MIFIKIKNHLSAFPTVWLKSPELDPQVFASWGSPTEGASGAGAVGGAVGGVSGGGESGGVYTPLDPSVVTREVQSKHSGVTVKVKVRVRDGALVEGDCSKDEKKVRPSNQVTESPNNQVTRNVYIVKF